MRNRGRIPGGSGRGSGLDQLREARDGGGVGHAQTFAEVGEERQAELGAEAMGQAARLETIGARTTRWIDAMPKFDDLSRSLIPFDQTSTLLMVQQMV